MFRQAVQQLGKTACSKSTRGAITSSIRHKTTYTKINSTNNAAPPAQPTSAAIPQPPPQSQASKPTPTPFSPPQPSPSAPQPSIKITPFKAPEHAGGEVQQAKVVVTMPNSTKPPKAQPEPLKVNLEARSAASTTSNIPKPQTTSTRAQAITPASTVSAASKGSTTTASASTNPARASTQTKQIPPTDTPSKSAPLLTRQNSTFSKKVKSRRGLIASFAILSYFIYNGYQLSTQLGAQRSWTFWTRAFPIYLDYEFLMNKLIIQQALTDLLIKYDPENFAIPVVEGQTATTTQLVDEEKYKATKQYYKAMAQEVELDNQTHPEFQAQTDPENSPPHFTRPVPIEETQNDNHLDRLFAEVATIAADIRKSDEFLALQGTMSKIVDDPRLIQDQLPILFRQTKDVIQICPTLRSITYFVKKHIHNLGNNISQQFHKSDLLSDQSKEIIVSTAKYMLIRPREIVLGATLRALSPYLRPYTLPLDLTEKQQHRAAQFDVLNHKYAADLYNIIAELRGYYIKIGQLGSLRTELIPPIWQAQLKRFQNDCPYTPLSELIPLIESQIGKISDNFEFIEPIPLGAASIGQVHKARLKAKICPETGHVLVPQRDVVLKLQYPDVEATFQYDMDTIRSFCELAQPEQVPQLKEIERSFLSEFNFHKEAIHLSLSVHDLEDRFPPDLRNGLAIPKPIPELCSKHCLTMEYFPGPRLIDHLQTMAKQLAKEQDMTLDEFMDQYGKQPPPTSEELAKFKNMASWYDWSWNNFYWMYNNTIAPVTSVLGKGDKAYYEYQHTTVPIDIRSIVDKVYQVHGNQLFFGHHFNSDCHPGNLLWIEDKFDKTDWQQVENAKKWSDNTLGGTVGLIDYGQVKTLDLFARAMYAHTMIALEEEDWEKVVLIYILAGNRTARNTFEVAVDYTLLGLEYDDDELRQGMNIEQYFEHLNSVDKALVASDDAFMPSRCTLFLRSLPQHLGYTVKTSKHWAPVGRRFLSQHPILNELIESCCAEIRPEYRRRLATAKARSIQDFGSESHYFVDLDDFWYITDWCKTIGSRYNRLVYPQIFTHPTPFDFREITTDVAPQTRLYDEERIKALTHTLSIDQFIPDSLVDDEVTPLSPSEPPYDANTTNHVPLPIFTAYSAPASQLKQKPPFLARLQSSYSPPFSPTFTELVPAQQLRANSV